MDQPPGKMSILKTHRFILTQAIRRHREGRKASSSGRDLAVYCGRGPSGLQWGPQAATAVSGSEQAVIHLTRALARLGWTVTVYNNCGDRPQIDGGVVYRPYWEFSPRDRHDVLVLWRQFKLLDLEFNAGKVVVDLHDAGNPGVSDSRLRKVDRIFAKSQFHRSYLPDTPDHKIAIVPNGLDLDGLRYEPEAKDPYLLVNTSAPERSMDVLPGLFREIRRRVPQARLQWAFGWDLFMRFESRNRAGLAWAERIRRDMADAGIEDLGRLGEAEVAVLLRRAAIYAYPTAFHETDCISVKKAQACGCVPVTGEAGALAETVRHGIRIPLRGDNPLRDASGLTCGGIKDPATQAAWVDAVVDLLRNPDRRRRLAQDGADWARQWDWAAVAARWDAILREPGHREAGARRS